MILNFVTRSKQFGLILVTVTYMMAFVAPTVALSDSGGHILRLEKLVQFEFHGLEDRRGKPCLWTFSGLRKPPTGRFFRDARLQIPSAGVDLKLRYQGTSQEIEALSTDKRSSRYELGASARYELVAYDLKGTKHSIVIHSKAKEPMTIRQIDVFNVGGVVGAEKLIAECDQITLVEKPRP
jgi:hypothetical protein